MRDLIEALTNLHPQDAFAATALAMFWFGLFTLIERFFG